MSKKPFLLAMILLPVLAGCVLTTVLPDPVASERYRKTELLLEDDFNTPENWYRYDSPGVYVQVEDGGYHMRLEGGAYVWGINAVPHEDVVIEAETHQLADDGHNGYGVVCRANPDNNGDGYYFLISGDGTYTIRRGQGRTVEPLIAWTNSDTINQGRAVNRIRAVCIDRYLALHINGTFVSETRDDLYSRGVTGFAAVATEGGQIDVAFDDLRVWSASLAP